jgi:IS5 family transposase
MRRAIKRQRTIVGRLQREIERKAGAVSAIGQAVREALAQTLSKAQDGQRKLYSFHAPEVDCISKGKAKTPYEFGVKVGIASTLKGNLIVGARAFHGNPYDGHTLREQLEQATILMQDIRTTPATAFVDLGYRGVDADNPDVHIVHRGKAKRISQQDRRLLKRRQAIEPIIGHLKADHRMDRCHLKGQQGDRLHAVLCAAGYNIRWLLRMIARKGITSLQVVFLCLQWAGAQARSWAARIRSTLCVVPILDFGTLVRA